MKVYLIGSLKNPQIPVIADALRQHGHDVYDQWWCPGPEADQHWQEYCRTRGWTYRQALNEWHAKQIFEIDKFHLDRSEIGVLVYKAGKSGHMELGYLLGQRKRGYILINGKEPDQYDIMPRMATGVFDTLEELIQELAL